jgi:RNA polymerase sigma-54 factor
MRLSLGQQMQMAQKQVLAPRMIQSMEILQLPIMALQERIEQAMAENPVLDQAESAADEAEEQVAEEVALESPDAPTEAERELVVDDANDNEEDFERLMNLADDWPDHFDERSRPSRGRLEEESNRKQDAMANMAARPPSLHDYLHDQLGWFELDQPLRQMADRIIYNLDSNGYLKTPLEELIDPNADQQQLELAQEALALVQRLDPRGVGARDLKECLLQQLTVGMPYYEELRTLITSHLEDLENNRLPAIQRRTGYSISHIQEVWEELRKLNPKPGAIFNETLVPNVTPDVILERSEGGDFTVRLEDGQLPSLFISPYYRKLLRESDTNPETRDYIKRKINAAQWLIDSIEQRRNTLTRVAQAIVEHQIEFLDKGPEHVEPLKMQQIADKVHVHVTTVSRAVDDKWIQTPRGIFPLRRFFVGGTVSASGQEVAWDTIRMKLQEIIDQEDKQKPLSDDDIVGQLATQGLKVARRTVTKYRKSMGIPSSRQRRDWSKGS